MWMVVGHFIVEFIFSPLEGVDDSATFFETPHRPQGTPRKRPISVLAINGQYSPLVHIDPTAFLFNRCTYIDLW